MAESEQPQIYLVTPPEFELSTFSDRLARVLDGHPVACVRLALASHDEDRVARAADALRALTHARDIALVIESHFLMVGRHGLDGVHLPDGARRVRKVRKELGKDAIIGAACGPTRHEGMTAAEAGADYVSFGPVGMSALGDGQVAPRALFAWWSEMIETPVVAEGALTPELVADLRSVSDFFAIGPEIWTAPDAVAALARLVGALDQV